MIRVFIFACQTNGWMGIFFDGISQGAEELERDKLEFSSTNLRFDGVVNCEIEKCLGVVFHWAYGILMILKTLYCDALFVEIKIEKESKKARMNKRWRERKKEERKERSIVMMKKHNVTKMQKEGAFTVILRNMYQEHYGLKSEERKYIESHVSVYTGYQPS